MDFDKLYVDRCGACGSNAGHISAERGDGRIGESVTDMGYGSRSDIVSGTGIHGEHI